MWLREAGSDDDETNHQPLLLTRGPFEATSSRPYRDRAWRIIYLGCLSCTLIGGICAVLSP